MPTLCGVAFDFKSEKSSLMCVDMSDVKIGQLRRIKGTGEVILVTGLDKIAILHGDLELVDYLANGEVQTSELAWVLLRTESIDSI